MVNAFEDQEFVPRLCLHLRAVTLWAATEHLSSSHLYKGALISTTHDCESQIRRRESTSSKILSDVQMHSIAILNLSFLKALSTEKVLRKSLRTMPEGSLAQVRWLTWRGYRINSLGGNEQHWHLRQFICPTAERAQGQQAREKIMHLEQERWVNLKTHGFPKKLKRGISKNIVDETIWHWKMFLKFLRYEDKIISKNTQEDTIKVSYNKPQIFLKKKKKKSEYSGKKSKGLWEEKP